jgi:hypothetical protein
MSWAESVIWMESIFFIRSPFRKPARSAGVPAMESKTPTPLGLFSIAIPIQGFACVYESPKRIEKKNRKIKSKIWMEGERRDLSGFILNDIHFFPVFLE